MNRRWVSGLPPQDLHYISPQSLSHNPERGLVNSPPCVTAFAALQNKALLQSPRPACLWNHCLKTSRLGHGNQTFRHGLFWRIHARREHAFWRYILKRYGLRYITHSQQSHGWRRPSKLQELFQKKGLLDRNTQAYWIGNRTLRASLCCSCDPSLLEKKIWFPRCRVGTNSPSRWGTN